MIDEALALIASRLNEHLWESGPRHDVVVAPPFESDGSVPAVNVDKLVVSLVGVEQVGDGHGSASRIPAEPEVRSPVHLDLTVLVASFSPSYTLGLERLARAIAFLHDHSVFDPRSSPALAPGIEKLVLTPVAYDAQDLGAIWARLGGGYVPSTIYRVRVVSADRAG